MKLCWSETHFRGVPTTTSNYNAPFTGTPEPSIPMREVFSGVSFEEVLFGP